jgi:aminoglycoside phosphotransferase (APT) family kinase protein
MSAFPDGTKVDAALVRRLLAREFPQWAALALAPVASAGTDNAIFRLGDDKVVRLPRVDWALAQPEKEHRWLAWLAPQLPLRIPVPVALGSATDAYPSHWSILGWIDGEEGAASSFGDLAQAARDIGAFVRALRSVDAHDGPAAGHHNSFRGVPLRARDAVTRDALAQLQDELDGAAAARVWEEALRLPRATRTCWVHGDLQARNLLAQSGRLHAVIDFGCLGVGDPAVDLIVAWNLFDRTTRETFREAAAVDEPTWLRGRGWALSIALVALPYYRASNPVIARESRRTIGEILSESAAST